MEPLLNDRAQRFLSALSFLDGRFSFNPAEKRKRRTVTFGRVVICSQRTSPPPLSFWLEFLWLPRKGDGPVCLLKALEFFPEEKIAPKKGTPNFLPEYFSHPTTFRNACSLAFPTSFPGPLFHFSNKVFLPSNFEFGPSRI